MKKIAGYVTVLLMLLAFSVTVCAGATKEDAIEHVKKAVVYFKMHGREKLLAEINNPTGQFVKGELYLFAEEFNGVMLAHGANPKLTGKNLLKVKDSDGKPIFQEFIKTAKQGGGWVEYKWTNPVTKKIEAKVSYIYPIGGFLIACGIYK